MRPRRHRPRSTINTQPAPASGVFEYLDTQPPAAAFCRASEPSISSEPDGNEQRKSLPLRGVSGHFDAGPGWLNVAWRKQRPEHSANLK